MGIECEISADRCVAFGIGALIDIIDVRICDVNQASYQTRKPVSIIESAENEK